MANWNLAFKTCWCMRHADNGASLCENFSLRPPIKKLVILAGLVYKHSCTTRCDSNTGATLGTDTHISLNLAYSSLARVCKHECPHTKLHRFILNRFLNQFKLSQGNFCGQASPQCQLFATKRKALNIQGEVFKDTTGTLRSHQSVGTACFIPVGSFETSSFRHCITNSLCQSSSPHFENDLGSSVSQKTQAHW